MAAAEVRLTRRFQRSLEKLDRTARERVREAVGTLVEDPRAGKRLRGDLEGEWSLCVGAYRVLYAIEQSVVWVETVRHRREVYR